MIPKVALIGRPNTGKSTLFNIIAEKNKAIIYDIPGVTRDRLISKVDYYGKKFNLIDTGGFEDAKNEMGIHIQEQIKIALSQASIVLFVVDTNITSDDLELAKLIRKANKETILVVNKCDSEKKNYFDFYKLGFNKVIPVSAIHRKGIGVLLDELTKNFKKNNDDEEIKYPKITIAGRPNTGKSTLLNSLIKEKRAVTSDKPGTTRDAIEVELATKFGNYIFIDTAGVRRHSKTESGIEKFSINLARKEIKLSDITLLIIDGNEGVTSQDKRVAQLVNELGTACIILVNKKDIKKPSEKEIYNELIFLNHCPMLFISAKFDKDFNKIFKSINLVLKERYKKISTNSLNTFLKKVTNLKTPPMSGTRDVKLKYIVQAAKDDKGYPRFIIFSNYPDGVHSSYIKYLIRKLREEYGFIGNPIDLIFKAKGA